MLVRKGSEFQKPAARATPGFEEKIAVAIARDASVREERERASRVTASPKVLSEAEDLSFIGLEGIFKPGAPIIAATKKFFVGTNPEPLAKTAIDGKTTLVLAPPSREVQYINIAHIPGGNATLSNSLTAIVIPNSKQYLQPTRLENCVSFLNNMLITAATSPAAKKISQTVKEKGPAAAKVASDIAVYKVAPKVVDATYWAAEKSATPTFQKWAKRLSPIFALMATSSIDQNLDKTSPESAIYIAAMGKENAAATITIDMSAVPLSYCSKDSPMLVEGILSTFRLTDSDTCRRVLQAVPKVSENFTTYNKNISIK
ncbi:MAG: hypothetical protein DI586_01020, partial [Micavibrio aeruginosavorus]